MSERRQDDLSAIAWPGFVDILSAVIIMFVFFLMIVATALFFHIIIFISKIESDIIKEDVQSEYEYQFAQAQTEFAEAKEQTMEVDTESDEILVFFGGDSISITPEVKQQIGAHLEELLSKRGPDGYQFNIYAARAAKGVDFVNRKVAVSRMLNIRNAIMNTGFLPTTIKAQMVKGYEIEGKEHWVRVEIKEKQ